MDARLIFLETMPNTNPVRDDRDYLNEVVVEGDFGQRHVAFLCRYHDEWMPKWTLIWPKGEQDPDIEDFGSRKEAIARMREMLGDLGISVVSEVADVTYSELDSRA